MRAAKEGHRDGKDCKDGKDAKKHTSLPSLQSFPSLYPLRYVPRSNSSFTLNRILGMTE